MVNRKNYPRRRVPYKARTKKANVAAKRKSISIKKMVRTEIARNIENKTVQYIDNNYSIYPVSNAAAFDGNIVPCYPAASYLQINQSLAQDGRVGNRVKIKNLRVSGIVFPRGYSASNNTTPTPTTVKFYFFYDKEEPQTVPTPQTSGDILQFGSSSLPFQNTLFDLSMPINTDRYRVLTTRTLKVGWAEYGGTGATGSQPLQGNLTNNDFKLNAKLSVNLTKYCVKNCLFRDNASTPTTRGIYMMAVPQWANGTSIPSTQIPVRMSYMMTCDYEDA